MANQLALEKIETAELLVKKLMNFSEKDIFGIHKLRKKIEVEIAFLKKGVQSKNLKIDSVLCSNLGQLSSIGEEVLSLEGVTSVLKKFNLSNDEKLLVDIVGKQGTKWYKIILRNPKALHLAYMNGTKKGGRTIDQIALTYIEAADMNPVLFCPPKVYFVFVNGVSDSLAQCLENYGVIIEGDVIDDDFLNVPNFNADSSDDEDESYNGNSNYVECISCTCSVEKDASKVCDICNAQDFKSSLNLMNTLSTEGEMGQELNLQNLHILQDKTRRVNLDVSCMIAYTSSTCNGGSNFIFRGKFLTEQAEWERRNPVKKIIDDYFEGCELIACNEAACHFQLVLETVGGLDEIERGDKLLKRCKLVESNDLFKDQLPIGGRIKKLSRIIFGTGQALRAPTITSNIGFIRAAENKGLSLAVLYHEPRALTEKKQSLATPISQTENLVVDNL